MFILGFYTAIPFWKKKRNCSAFSADVLICSFFFRKGFSDWFLISYDNCLFSAGIFLLLHQLSLLSALWVYLIQAAPQEKDKYLFWLRRVEIHGIFYCHWRLCFIIFYQEKNTCSETWLILQARSSLQLAAPFHLVLSTVEQRRNMKFSLPVSQKRANVEIGLSWALSSTWAPNPAMH